MKTPTYRVVTSISLFYNQHPRPTRALWINSHKPLLNNADIREGIQHATNWQLSLTIFQNDPVRMQTSSDGYGEFTHPTLRAREYDIDKAQEFFAKAGFVERGPDGIKVNEQGQRLSFTLSTGWEPWKDILTILKEEASRAGLEFRIEVLDGTWLEESTRKETRHSHGWSKRWLGDVPTILGNLSFGQRL